MKLTPESKKEWDNLWESHYTLGCDDLGDEHNQEFICKFIVKVIGPQLFNAGREYEREYNLRGQLPEGHTALSLSLKETLSQIVQNKDTDVR